MSRGGREVCDVVETAWRHGARFDAWTEFFSLDTWRAACAECGVDMEAHRPRAIRNELGYTVGPPFGWRDHALFSVVSVAWAGGTHNARLQLRTLLGVWRVSEAQHRHPMPGGASWLISVCA